MCGVGERPCPKCGNTPVSQVVVWNRSARLDSDDVVRLNPPPNARFGLGFAGADGIVCCSFAERAYGSVEEATAAIAARSFDDFCNDEDTSYINDWDDMIGDQDPVGDPYPELPEY